MFLPIHARDWLCRAPGRKDHCRVLYRHPLTGLRRLLCGQCDNDEIIRWLASRVIPRPESALVVEDNAERQQWFYTQLRNVKVDLTYRVDEALTLLREKCYDLVCLDFDLNWRETGLANINTMPIAAFLRTRPEIQVLIHSQNPAGVLALRQLLPDAIVSPFGSFEFSQPKPRASSGIEFIE